MAEVKIDEMKYGHWKYYNTSVDNYQLIPKFGN